ncbi:MAG: hypothetical protein CMG04_09905 [Candidatus Marinimicrobia bacterium]|nr:hypothetical protein [Candidatus Neomarinimicrobiota bacterium]|tara:strand:- start:71 stop:532 length:462 start_codon:yes stop_codon:yes gene_type:complete
MKKMTFAIILSLLGMMLNAQTFSKAEQKVIDAVSEYWSLSNKDKKAWKNTFHESYRGWNKNNEALSNKSMVSKWIDYNFGKDEVLFWNINPIGVQLYDDIAIVHYYYMTITKDRENGKSTTSNGRWTDILMNVKGSWKIVSDHGGKKESKSQE